MVRADKQLSARLSTEFERQRSEQSQKDAELSKLQQELNICVIPNMTVWQALPHMSKYAFDDIF